MPLEDSNRIDIITRDPDGKPCLVITDSGLTTDPDMRFALLVEKATRYLGHVMSEDFRLEYPGLKPGDARILVLCAVPPTDKMISFSRLTHPEDEMEWIGIEYRLFEGSQADSEIVPDDTEALPVRDASPLFQRTIFQWIWIFVCVGLLGSALYRLVILKQSPLTPLLILFFVWRLRIYMGRRRWEKIKADMIAGGVDPRFFRK